MKIIWHNGFYTILLISILCLFLYLANEFNKVGVDSLRYLCYGMVVGIVGIRVLAK